jgi:hypothetical protein
MTEEQLMQDYNRDVVDQVVLALLWLTLHDGDRAWKGFEEYFGIASAEQRQEDPRRSP